MSDSPDDDAELALSRSARRHLRLVHSTELTEAKRMQKLDRSDLFSLEQYASERNAFRARVIAHKQDRKLHLGDHVSLLFEDRLTVQYQIQEMLRIERIFEAEAIREELDTYNPLIPDGSNLKATMLIEYPDAVERTRVLATLGGIEHRVYAEVEGFARAFAIADEDLDRSDEDKTSAVHFLRFEFEPAAIMALRAGAVLTFGLDDPRMPERVVAGGATRTSLLADLG